MVFLNVWNVRIVLADDSDIFGNNIAPNVMILLDSFRKHGGHCRNSDCLCSGHDVLRFSLSRYHYQCDDRLQQKDEWKRFWSRKLQQFKSLLHGLCNKLRPKPTQNCSGVSSTSAKNALASAGYWSGSHQRDQPYNLLLR